MNTTILNNQTVIPSVGFGVFLIPNDGPTYEAVLAALKAGYRHIDTAAAYMNESDVGKAIKDSGIPREEIFVTSKLWLQDYGYENAKRGIQDSLDKLGLDYIDLYLLHQPYGDIRGAWKALEEAYHKGILKAIGVSNMTVKFLKDFLPSCEVMPAVNQVECNPLFQQKELREYMKDNDIKVEAWFPLGHGSPELLSHPVITALAEKYHKNAGQIILRFLTQEGIIVLPKSTNPVRIAGNIDLFDIELTEDEMNSLRALDTGKGTHDPEDMSNATRLSALKVHD